ncbi:UDP-N-acetylmuramoyl-tripeptide--D-alanyl-D-alanine ligase [Paenibacillus tarimensis]|uniref:UDP-N-acetylmuramoyl-tripeptide--D-alanyl-D- alanine ligase n=1 Tax=Paenibacillus tarimensis TaxID=416012 RepID=UPI001F3F8A34|nr:UDP-N-acetylmuramoyl-tripeptide--D-alanyl-D-alanine ligase [Paenibacillus tarimensis]MCF2942112.1 UDP-N-acetylmuramoyl-tripeptide--D-alanyl-D-alanine ligase [Paenibacillus tarimensis]
MINRTFTELASMCGGTLNEAAKKRGGDRFCGTTTDSRRATEGQLFIPLAGERFDGHQYTADCFDRGIAIAFWQQDRLVPEELSSRPLVFVPDTLAALQKLASSYRRQLPVRIIGITGSNGKTTTKDLVAAVLAVRFRVHKTEGNLNNHIGLPLTILAMDENVEYAVLEMGMSGFGEISLLTRIAEPQIAMITNIGDAHLLQLGSREGIAKAKLEIAEGVTPGGVLLINGDEPLLTGPTGQAALASMAEDVKVQTFGFTESCDWRAEPVSIDVQSSAFRLYPALNSTADTMLLELPVPGRHNISNAAAAAAAGRLCGLTEEQIAEGMAGTRLTGMRIESLRAFNGATLLNDAYNANPTAVRAAISLVSELTGFSRKWLVLADMLELGPEEQKLHYEIGAMLRPGSVDRLLTYGPLSWHTAEGAKQHLGEENVRHFEDKAALNAYLREHLATEDLVLVKGSRGMRMEETVQALER